MFSFIEIDRSMATYGSLGQFCSLTLNPKPCPLGLEVILLKSKQFLVSESSGHIYNNFFFLKFRNDSDMCAYLIHCNDL